MSNMNDDKPGKAIHSVHNMNFHLVLVTKYRRKVITDEISEQLKDIFERLGKNHGIELKEWNHDKDHVHALYTALPTTCHSKFVNVYKSAGSRLVKKEHPEVRKKLWKEFFWSRSYYISTAGGVTLDIIRHYIEEQGR